MPPAAVALIDQISVACFRSFTTLPNARLLEDDGVFGVRTDVPLTFFSGIATARLHTRDDAARVIARFTASRTPFRWWLTPSTEPADLETALQEHGMRHAFDSTGMHRELATLEVSTADVRIDRVRDTAAMMQWADVLTAGFARPAEERAPWCEAYARLGFDDAWAHFVGYVDDTAVATTSLLMAGELAGIYHVVTLPPWRGRGIGSAVTLAAMQYAQERGATTAVLQSSAMGLSVYRGLGFHEDCPLRLYDWRA